MEAVADQVTAGAGRDFARVTSAQLWMNRERTRRDNVRCRQGWRRGVVAVDSRGGHGRHGSLAHRTWLGMLASGGRLIADFKGRWSVLGRRVHTSVRGCNLVGACGSLSWKMRPALAGPVTSSLSAVRRSSSVGYCPSSAAALAVVECQDGKMKMSRVAQSFMAAHKCYTSKLAWVSCTFAMVYGGSMTHRAKS